MAELNALRLQVIPPWRPCGKPPGTPWASRCWPCMPSWRPSSSPPPWRPGARLSWPRENPSWPGSTASCGASSAGPWSSAMPWWGEMPSDLGEFARLLRLLLSRYTVGTIPASLDRVTVGTPPRLGGAAGKVLFLLGAEDGAIPQVTLGAGLLTDRDRELLEDYGLALSPPGWRKSWTGRAPSSTPSAPNPRRSSTSPGRPRGRGGKSGPPSWWTPSPPSFPSGGDGPSCPVPRCPSGPGSPGPGGPGSPGRGSPLPDPLPPPGPGGRLDPGQPLPQAVEALYGKKVAMSASRMDQYQSCHFAYFLRYGLQAKDRRPAGFDAPAYGSFVHFVLERVLRALRNQGGAAQAEEETIRAPHRPGGGGLRPPGVGGMAHQTPGSATSFTGWSGVQAVVDNVVAEPGTPTSSPSALSWASAQGKTCPRWRSPRGASPPDLRFRGPGGRLGGGWPPLPPGGGLQDRPETLTSPRCGTAWGRRCSSTSSPWRRRGGPLRPPAGAGGGALPPPPGTPWSPAPYHGRGRLTPAAGQGVAAPGLILDQEEVVQAMEHGAGELRFLPLRVSAPQGRSPGRPW